MGSAESAAELAHTGQGVSVDSICLSTFDTGALGHAVQGAHFEHRRLPGGSPGPHGDSVTQKYTGDFNRVSNIDTTDGVRLYKLVRVQRFRETFEILRIHSDDAAARTVDVRDEEE